MNMLFEQDDKLRNESVLFVNYCPKQGLVPPLATIACEGMFNTTSVGCVLVAGGWLDESPVSHENEKVVSRTSHAYHEVRLHGAATAFAKRH